MSSEKNIKSAKTIDPKAAKKKVEFTTWDKVKTVIIIGLIIAIVAVFAYQIIM